MTAATTSGPASADALGATSGEVADRLRLAMARFRRRLVHTHPDAGMTPSRLTALGALEAAGPLRIGGLAEILGTSPPTTSRLVEACTSAASSRARPTRTTTARPGSR